jgi:nucleotide-binding universal stress UspA family protein
MTNQANRTILSAVDFGQASARAVEAAGALAGQWPADLVVLHAEALEAPVYFTHEQVEALAAQRRELHGQAVAFLERFGRRHTTQPFTPVVVPKPPTDAILDHATSAALTVMGTHGRRGPRRWWLGSVAERVLRRPGRPCWSSARALMSRRSSHESACAPRRHRLAIRPSRWPRNWQGCSAGR